MGILFVVALTPLQHRSSSCMVGATLDALSLQGLPLVRPDVTVGASRMDGITEADLCHILDKYPNLTLNMYRSASAAVCGVQSADATTT